jgi:hypothetical protein
MMFLLNVGLGLGVACEHLRARYTYRRDRARVGLVRRKIIKILKNKVFIFQAQNSGRASGGDGGTSDGPCRTDRHNAVGRIATLPRRVASPARRGRLKPIEMGYISLGALIEGLKGEEADG